MDVNIKDSLNIDGWMSEKELEWLAETASKCKLMLEIGSWRGRSTLAIAQHLQDDAKLWCVDAWIGMLSVESGADPMTRGYAEQALVEFKKNLEPYLLKLQVNILQMESIAASETLLSWGVAKKFDWIFIDGDHSYETVSKEIAAFKPLVKPGGMLSGHDYYFPSVSKAVHESLNNIVVPHATTIWTCEVE